MPGLPKSWIDRRRRKLRRVQREALARIGLATAGSPNVGETTMCIAYMCPWAHTCSGAAQRPALVAERDCLRKFNALIQDFLTLRSTILPSTEKTVSGLRV